MNADLFICLKRVSQQKICVNPRFSLRYLRALIHDYKAYK